MNKGVFFWCSLLFILMSENIVAQTLKGKVTDENGSAIVDAKVRILKAAGSNSTIQETYSGKDGSFEFQELPTDEMVFINVFAYGYQMLEEGHRIKEKLRLKFELKESIYQIPQVNILDGDNESGLFKDIPGSVSLIEAKTIEKSVPLSGNEMIRKAPGVHVVDEEGLGLRTNIGIRGLDPGRSRSVLILEDGVPVALSPYGEPEMYYTPAIDRMAGVEILKGSGSILFGPQTIGGVVNYITKDPLEAGGGSVRLMGGQGGYFNGQINYGQSFEDKSGFQINFLRKQAEEIGMTNFLVNDLSMKYAYKFNDKHRLGFKLGIYDETSNSTYIGLTQTMFDAGGQDFTHMAPDDVLDIRRYSASVNWEWQMSERLQLQTLAYAYTTTRNWARQDYAYQDNLNRTTLQVWGDESIPGGAAYMFDANGHRNRTFEVTGIENRLTYDYQILGLESELKTGVRYLYERAFENRLIGSKADAGSGFLREDEVRTGHGLSYYLHNQFKITKAFSITGGVRMEHFDYERHILRGRFGENNAVRDTNLVSNSGVNALIPGIGFNLNLHPNLAIFGGIHRGFAPPRIKDAISNDGETYDLDAELSWNTEVGLRGKKGRILTYEMTLFQMDFSNQIIPVAEFAGGLGAGEVNAGATMHRGVELAASHDLGFWFESDYTISLSANITLIDAYFNADRFKMDGDERVNIRDNRTPYAPDYLLTGGLFVNTPFGLSMQINATYTGAQYTDELNSITPSPNGRVGKIAAYSLWDASLHYQIPSLPQMTCFVSAKNITDERYIVTRRPQGIRVGIPRYVSGGFQYRF